MLYYMLYSEGLDAIARHYIRQQADDPHRARPLAGRV